MSGSNEYSELQFELDIFRSVLNKLKTQAIHLRNEETRIFESAWNQYIEAHLRIFSKNIDQKSNKFNFLSLAFDIVLIVAAIYAPGVGFVDAIVKSFFTRLLRKKYFYWSLLDRRDPTFIRIALSRLKSGDNIYILPREFDTNIKVARNTIVAAKKHFINAASSAASNQMTELAKYYIDANVRRHSKTKKVNDETGIKKLDKLFSPVQLLDHWKQEINLNLSGILNILDHCESSVINEIKSKDMSVEQLKNVTFVLSQNLNDFPLIEVKTNEEGNSESDIIRSIELSLWCSSYSFDVTNINQPSSYQRVDEYGFLRIPEMQIENVVSAPRLSEHHWDYLLTRFRDTRSNKSWAEAGTITKEKSDELFGNNISSEEKYLNEGTPKVRFVKYMNRKFNSYHQLSRDYYMNLSSELSWQETTFDADNANIQEE